MRGDGFLVLLAALLLGGCELLPPSQWSRPLPAPDQLLEQARALREQGRWEDALALLREGLRGNPGEPRLRVARGEMEHAWARRHAELEDRLRAADAAAMLTRRELLGRLEVAERFDPLNQSRLAMLDARLRDLRSPLIRCAERQSDVDIELARRCARLAGRIHAGEDVTALMHLLGAEQARSLTGRRAGSRRRHRARARTTATPPQGKPETATDEKAERLAGLLDRATEALDNGALIEALAALDEARALDDKDARYLRLRQRARLDVGHKVAALSALGDRLYREEQLQPALTIWRLALRLAPDDAALKEKIGRAERVAAKLARIRARQAEALPTPSSGAESTSTPRN